MTGYQSPVLIPLTFVLGALLVPLLGAIYRPLARLTAVGGSSVALMFSISGLQVVLAEGAISYHVGGWMPPVGIEFVLDPLSAFFCVLITGVSLMALVYSGKSLESEIPEKVIPFYSLAMLLLAGLSGMVITGDLFNLYVFLEIGALASYALLAIGNRRASFSAFRYLTLGTLGAAFYLLGVAFIYISTGSLNMTDVANLLPLFGESRPVTVGLALIMLGAAVKMGLFPLHAWMPDGYANASSAATALIAPIGTKVAVYILIRTYMLSDFPPMSELITWLAAVGIIAGSVLAISQTDLKRMLAYSSVANIGYIALGFSLANHLAFAGAMLHILNHALMKAVLFMVAGGILYKMKTVDITQLRGFPQRMPFTCAAFIIAALSMVGIPPTGGFFSKVYLILGAVEAGLWLLVAVILVSTLLNFYYFFRVIEYAFFKPDRAQRTEDETGFEKLKVTEANLSMIVPMLILSAAIIIVGIYNGDIVNSVIRLAMPASFAGE
jgi:multicomponent Na+:H+ antiporter subunit D